MGFSDQHDVTTSEGNTWKQLPFNVAGLVNCVITLGFPSPASFIADTLISYLVDDNKLVMLYVVACFTRIYLSSGSSS